MDLVLEITDEARLLQALCEKAIIKSEEVEAQGEPRPFLDLHLATLELKRLAGDLHRIAEDLLVAALDGVRRVTIDGTTVEVRRSYRRTDWEHSKVATHVALTALGGEVIEGMDVVIDALLKACRPEWRVTALKDMGLNDEDYATRILGRATVAVL